MDASHLDLALTRLPWSMFFFVNIIPSTKCAEGLSSLDECHIESSWICGPKQPEDRSNDTQNAHGLKSKMEIP